MSGIQQGFMSFRSSVVPAPAGQQTYTSAGTYTWVAPAGVTKVSVFSVGGGSAAWYKGTGSVWGKGGSGGGAGYFNSICVTPGTGYQVRVGAGGSPYGVFGGSPPSSVNGGESYFCAVVKFARAFGGNNTCTSGSYSVGGGNSNSQGGGTGGGGNYFSSSGGTGQGVGGGGAAGYAGNGGCGGGQNVCNATAGSGGGGGGGAYDSSTGGGGGGVGLLGQGSNGAAGCRYTSSQRGGKAGSGGNNGGPGGNYYCCCTGTVYYGGDGGAYGGGGGGLLMNSNLQGSGNTGAVRIIWAGTTGITRAFPSTNTGNL
mgnify:CR=1 FL=1